MTEHPSPIPIVEETHPPTVERLRRVLNELILLRIAYDGSGFQSRFTVAIESLEEIPRDGA